MHRLQVAVRKVRGELDDARRLRRGLAQQLDAQADDVLAADAEQLAQLAHLLPRVDGRHGDRDEQRPEEVERLLELAVREHLVAELEPLDERGQPIASTFSIVVSVLCLFSRALLLFKVMH